MIGEHYLYFLGHNLSTRVAGRRAPLLAGVKLTYRCNLCCRVCPFWRQEMRQMAYDQVCEVFGRLYASGVRLVILEGGEPFLWKEGDLALDDVVAEAKRHFFFVGVTTNGTLPLQSNADALWVSIDGLRQTHNWNRGPVFDRVMANIASSNHRKLFANVTINSANCGEIPELIRYLQGKVKGVTIQFYYPYAGTEDLSLTDEQRRKVLGELVLLKRQGHALLDSIPVLQALADNSWRCRDWLIANADPDGTVNWGCYVKNRGAIDCRACGFAAHAEMSLAYDWNPAAINTGRLVFGLQ